MLIYIVNIHVLQVNYSRNWIVGFFDQQLAGHLKKFLQFTYSGDTLLHDPAHRGERIMEVGLSTKIKCQNTNPEELNQIYIINKGANRV